MWSFLTLLLTGRQTEECSCQDAAVDPPPLPPAALLHHLLHQPRQLHHQGLLLHLLNARTPILLPLLTTCPSILLPPLTVLWAHPPPHHPLLRYTLHVSPCADAQNKVSKQPELNAAFFTLRPELKVLRSKLALRKSLARSIVREAQPPSCCFKSLVDPPLLSYLLLISLSFLPFSPLSADSWCSLAAEECDVPRPGDVRLPPWRDGSKTSQPLGSASPSSLMHSACRSPPRLSLCQPPLPSPPLLSSPLPSL